MACCGGSWTARAPGALRSAALSGVPTCEDSYVMVLVSVWITGTSLAATSSVSSCLPLLKLTASAFTSGDCERKDGQDEDDGAGRAIAHHSPTGAPVTQVRGHSLHIKRSNGSPFESFFHIFLLYGMFKGCLHMYCVSRGVNISFQ